MCLLTFFPEGIQPDTDALSKGARYNADGHGFAIVIPAEGPRKARIIVRKSMKATSLIKEFALMRARYPEGPALFHSRITTDGETNLFNCHPFMHTGDKRTVIGHNGILPGSVRPVKGDDRSDTRIFAEEVAGVFRLHTVIGRRLAGEWMGEGNKIVILTVDPAYDSHGFIINASSGMWENGIWYSNSSYKGYRSYTLGSTYGEGYEYYGMSKAGFRDWIYCDMACGAKVATVSPYTGVCTNCGNCSMCYTKPCECELWAATSGKGEPLHKGSSNATVSSVIGGSPGEQPPDDADTYVATVEEFYQVLDEVERQDQQNQLQEAIALVHHLNNGGDLDDWDIDSPVRREVESWLDSGEAALVDGVIKRVADVVKEGDPDPEDDQDFLIYEGTKYALN